MCDFVRAGYIFELEEQHQNQVSLLELHERGKVKHQTRAVVTSIQMRYNRFRTLLYNRYMLVFS